MVFAIIPIVQLFEAEHELHRVSEKTFYKVVQQHY